MLELLESHIRGPVPDVTIQTRPPTTLPAHTSPSKPANKKMKWDKKGKDVVGEGEVIPLKKLEPYKRAKMAKRAQRKSLSEGVITERASNRYPRVQIWDPPFGIG